MKDAPTPEEPGKPEIATTATDDADGDKLVKPAAEAKVKDTVVYTNLIAGKSYTMKGQLIKKSDKSVVAEAEKTFTASESGNGTVELVFTFDASKLAGESAVAFEKCYEGDEVVATHEDLNDEDQTVEITKPEVEISKTAVADSAELPGAKLIITKKDSEDIVAQHTSTTQTWKVQLAPGEYTLTEITAPKGYEVAESINFTVNEDGLVGSDKVHMEDAPTPEEPKPEITEVTVTKVWNDADNQDGVRPANITVNLLADGTQAAKAVLNTSNNWTHTFTKLPKKNEAGAEIVYTVVEANVPAGYKASVDGTIITNTHAPETVNVSGKKTWNDADNQDGKRPASVTINLLKNGEKIQSKTVTEKDNWTYSWAGLAKYENGNEIKYTVTEDKVAGYQASISGYDVTNSYTPGKTSVAVVKTWADQNDKDAIRPESITVALTADGNVVETQVLNASNGWTYTWADLDENKDGKAIRYAVDEVTVPEGYTKAVTEDNGVFTVTNTHTPEEEKDENPWVTISKTDAATSAELPGATLIIKNKDGETVVTFVSGEEPARFQLEPGEYTLTEVTAPQGYEVAETISFTVNEEGLVGSDKVEMVDAPIVVKENPTVTISKTDAVTCEELPGAELIIRDAEGKIVESFVSTTEPTLVQLAPGKYTLTEITAPDGYEVAETIEFEVGEDGLVNGDKVEMKDAPTPVEEKEENPIVKISKQDATTKAELPGAELIITDTEGQVVARWISTDEVHEITLAPGDYTLTELTAPEGYLKAESISFTVDKSGLVGSDKVTMYDDHEGGEFIKDDVTVDVTLEKIWVDADGNTVAWPSGKSVTFTLQYKSGDEWKDYIFKGSPWTVTLDEANPTYEFNGLSYVMGDETAVYRAVETKIDGYEIAVSSVSDLNNDNSTLIAVNRPENNTPDGGKEEDTTEPGTTPDSSKEEDKIKPGVDEDKKTSTEGNTDKTTTNTNTNDTPGTTPGRTTTGTANVPTTTRRVVTTPSVAGASTVSSSKATATGDNNSIIWIVTAALAAAAITGAAVAVRRRRRGQD